MDSGCTKTVAGQRWLDVFEDTVGEQFKKGKSKNKFRFGKGGSVKSTGMVKLPIQLGDKKVSLMVDIVKVNVPLLLSKESMKKANTVLDFNNDTAEMFNQKLKLISTSSGHYALPIVLSRRENCTAQHVLLVNEHFSKKPDYHKIALKLHKQFAHCPAGRLKKFIKKSKLWKGDKQLLKFIDVVFRLLQFVQNTQEEPSYTDSYTAISF